MTDHTSILEAIQTLQESLEEQDQQRRLPGTHTLKLKSFHGHPQEDINDWTLKFDRLADFNSWSPHRKTNALPFYLEGLASTYFSHLPQAIQQDSTAVLEALKTRFSNAPLQFLLRQELNTRRQAPTESLEDYCKDIFQRCHRLA